MWHFVEKAPAWISPSVTGRLTWNRNDGFLLPPLMQDSSGDLLPAIIAKSLWFAWNHTYVLMNVRFLVWGLPFK